MELQKLTDWLWCLHTEVVQAYAVAGDDGVFLVDASTGGQDDAILECLARELSLRVEDVPLREIFLTHGHADHTGSAASLSRRTDATLLGPAAEAAIIAGEQAPGVPQLMDWEKPIFDEVMPKVPPPEPVRLDEPLSAGDVLSWPRPAELVAAPGHTVGQLVVWFPQDRVLLAADAMASHEGQPMLGVFNVDPEQAKDSFRRLCELPAEVACFGHGAPLLGDAQARLRDVAAAL